MTICKNCGMQVEDDDNKCNNCNASVREKENDEFYIQDIENICNIEDTSDFKKPLISKIFDFIPSKYTSRNSKAFFLIGSGSFFILGLIYIICMFVFMADICAAVGYGAISKLFLAQLGGFLTDASGLNVLSASPVWIIVFLAVNLFPIFFALKAFFDKKFIFHAIGAGLLSIILTLFSVIVWNICDASGFNDAIRIYINNMNMLSWFSLNDCLSEAWYLKIPLSIIGIVSFFLDRVIRTYK